MSFATILAILCITALEGYALANGINGTTLAAACTIIAGLGGYQAHKVKSKKDGKGTPPSV